MSGGLISGAIGASVAVLVYSSICLTLSTLLVCLLIVFGEKWTYVTIFSGFTAFSTLASICQQLHYAIAWEVVKQAQFDKAVKSQAHPGLALGGAAQIVDQILFFIQFYCYNVMSLNILFWTVALYTGAWGIRANWLGNWYDRVGPISKAFAILFPALIVGLLNVGAVIDSSAAFIVVAYVSMFSSLTIGSGLLILILYKYMKTRRLIAGYGHRGAWWASGESKSRRERDIGADGTMESERTSNTHSSIYDRALVTRFSIAFGILALFEVAIIVFTLFQANNNAAIVAAGKPDFQVDSAVSDILFFIPGVTASLVAFLVFGTAKNWRQYRDLVMGGCGIRKRILLKKVQRSEEAGRDHGLEFERLPSLKVTISAEERRKGKEAESRVRMFSIASEPRPSDTEVSDQDASSGSEAATRILDFHRPFPIAGGSSNSNSESINVRIEIEREFSAGPNESERVATPEYPRRLFTERLPARENDSR